MDLRSTSVCVLLAAGTAHAGDGRDLVGVVAGMSASGGEGGLVVAKTTYDGASDRVTVGVGGEVELWRRVRAIVRVDDLGGRARPGAGAGVQWLDEATHGVASTAYLVYKAEGFTEPEGELEATVAVARHLGGVRLGLDVTYGQDPEGRERDGELAFAIHAEPRRGLFAGAVGRYRDALGTSDLTTGIVRDGFGGATATLAVRSVGITAMAGVAGVAGKMTASGFGPAASLAIGAVF